jgi:GWxTD domain-containing protein
MKYLILFLFCSLSLSVFSLDFQVKHIVYQQPNLQSFVETQLAINPLTISYNTNSNKLLQGKVTITIFYKQINKIIKFDKFELMTKEFKDSNEVINQTADLLVVRRSLLNNGKYKIDIELDDGRQTNQMKDYELAVEDFGNLEKPKLSAICLVDTFFKANTTTLFTKNDLEIYPYIMDYYPTSKNKLHFYTELYCPVQSQGAKKVIKFYIKKQEKNVVIENTVNTIVLDGNPIEPILGDINIEELVSGNYILCVELTNRQNEKLDFVTLNFQRSKTNNFGTPNVFVDTINFKNIDISKTFVKDLNLEEISYRLNSIRPIAGQNEVRYIENLLKLKNEVLMKQFYYNFWVLKNNTNPYLAWSQYETMLVEVNINFATTNKYGFESPRGRVYLQYGPPNTITDNTNSPDTYPYQIWDYYELKSQRNVKFIFYLKELATNNYIQGYSNLFGELSDPFWATKIQATPASLDLDKSGFRSGLGSSLQNNISNNSSRINLGNR